MLQVADMVGVGLERSDLLGIVFGVLELNTKWSIKMYRDFSSQGFMC